MKIWRLMVAVALVAVFLAAGIWLREATRRPVLYGPYRWQSLESDAGHVDVEAARQVEAFWQLARQRPPAKSDASGTPP